MSRCRPARLLRSVAYRRCQFCKAGQARRQICNEHWAEASGNPRTSCDAREAEQASVLLVCAARMLSRRRGVRDAARLNALHFFRRKQPARGCHDRQTRHLAGAHQHEQRSFTHVGRGGRAAYS
jgi:hypothetical protein